VACAVAVGSACRSVSVEIGTLSGSPTAVPTLSTVVPVQPRTAQQTQQTVALPTPGIVSGDAMSSFAPRGTGGSGSATIVNREQRDSYPFDGLQGQLLEVRAKRTSGVTLEPRIEVLDPSGVNELSPGLLQFGPEVLVERKLASTGRYSIVISASQGAGPYSVEWSLDRFGQLTSDAQVAAEIAHPNQKDRYRFEATQGQLLNARVQRSSGVSLQPSINLIDPSGALEDSVDAFGLAQATLQRKLASSGTYLLVVGGTNTGPYQVTLSLR
jgi:hypothetical protein